MTRSDTIDLIMDIIKIYPNWKLPDNVQVDDVINSWHRYFEDIEKEHVDKALDEYVTIERNKYAPSVSDIYNLAKKHKPDSRFEGIDYWERRTKSAYPYEWPSEVYRTWYTTDREAQRFYNYLLRGIEAVEVGRIQERELIDFKEVLKGYEEKKCSMMKKD